MNFLPCDDGYLFSLINHYLHDEEYLLNVNDHDPHRNNQEYMIDMRYEMQMFFTVKTSCSLSYFHLLGVP